MTENTIGKICFIGGGNMARALIGGLKTNGYLMSDINVIEPDAEKRQALKATA
jgi:pyrroline-5-carboxylate reductase